MYIMARQSAVISTCGTNALARCVDEHKRILTHVVSSTSYITRVVYFEECCDLRFFFFQAEDGIRDLTVTGVQTCALPIFCNRCRLSILGTGRSLLLRVSLA